MEEYVIKKNQIRPEALDYHLLRQYGVDYIAKLGNKLWSDFNIHDPGITVLELLCYALTDLGYRTSFDIKDILTPEGGRGPQMQDTFIPAHEILSCHPLTRDDYRKWILEHIPHVRNVWIDTYDNDKTDNDKKTIIVPEDCFCNSLFSSQNKQKEREVGIKGFYRITVDMESLDELKKYRTTFGRKINGRFITKEEYEYGDNIKKYCKSYIRNMFLKMRALCEDIEDVVILDPVYVGICADIEIKSDIKYEPVIKEIGKRINDYMSPAIRFYSLSEMLEKGKPVEEIYQGYIPKLGFVDRDELNQFDKVKQLNVSDVVNLIMGIDGVLNVRHFHFMVDDYYINKKIVSVTNYSVKLEDSAYSFRFCSNDLDKSRDGSMNELVITRGLLSFKPDMEIEEKIQTAHSVDDFSIELPLPAGNNRELDDYISIQDEFPKTYKMGKEGIAGSETDLRKAQRLQFKGYLLFFDQLLADYLVQLDSVKDILSWKEGKDKTCLFKNLTGEEITDFSKVFSGYKGSKEIEGYDELIEPENVRLDRKNRFLNHLIARFNEEFVDYSILKFLNKEKEARKDFDEQELIVDKKAFLRNYADISRDRLHAFDYTEPINGGTGFFNRDRNICGLEEVLYGKLGIDTGFINRNLALKVRTEKGKVIFRDNRKGNYNDNFGVHVYEHILMCPLNGCVDRSTFLKLTTDVNRAEIINDPYSMQITVVVPGWLEISGNLEFRKFVEKVIRMEVPAHIAAKICWLNPYQMYMLETKYKKFLSVLARRPYPESESEWEKEYMKNLKELVEVFSTLRSIYPPTQLYSDVYSTSDYSTILDYSMLGGDNSENLWEYEFNEKTN